MNKTIDQTEISFDWLKTSIKETLKECHVPGAAVAVIRDGDVLFKEGFGYRDMSNQLPVTEETLFAIGSVTKSFTTMALSMLCDDGKFDWNTPIRRYLSDFQLADSYATEHATAIDFATHRTGLPRHDFLWYKSPDTREELVHKLRHLSMSKEFRTAFQYENLSYMVLGYLAGKLAGSGWEEVIRERIFDPLKMKRSNFSADKFVADSNSAKPYRYNGGKSIEIPYVKMDAIGPAGGISTTLDDLIPWVKMHLDSGKSDGKQLVSEVSLRRMFQPHIVTAGETEPEILMQSYGLGWQIDAYRGYTLVHHSGNINGFTAKIALIPRRKIGVIILCNQDTSLFPLIVARTIIDKLLSLENADWTQRLTKRFFQMMKVADTQSVQVEAERIQGTSLSHPLESYTGTFSHPAYGQITVTLLGDQLFIKTSFLDIPYALEHYHYDVFLLKADLGHRELTLRIPFTSDVQGNINKMSMRLEATLDRIEFTRIMEPQNCSTSDPLLLVGEYALSSGFTVDIALNDNHNLIMTIPGQPGYELMGQENGLFLLKGVKGFSVQFIIGENKPCSEIILTQPNGVFKLSRKK